MAENTDGEAEVLAQAQVDAELYTESFFKQLPSAVKDRRETDRGFRSRLEKRWRAAFRLFEGVLLLGQQLGIEFYEEERIEAVRRNDLIFAALTRLHAQSCLLFCEIIALLKSGHASGAYGRWRTFHETAITAWFISNGDQMLAEKYLAHQDVKAFEDAEEFQLNCAALGLKPIPEKEMDTLRGKYNRLKQEYGDSFAGGYGWAADAIRAKLPDLKGRSISFNHLERASDHTHMRSYYRFASHTIHPTSKGVQYNIGLIKQGEMLLSGPSNYGLAEPATMACLSLQQATAALLMHAPNPQRIASLIALKNMVAAANSAFARAEKRIVKEDPEIRAGQFRSPVRGRK